MPVIDDRKRRRLVIEHDGRQIGLLRDAVTDIDGRLQLSQRTCTVFGLQRRPFCRTCVAGIGPMMLALCMQQWRSEERSRRCRQSEHLHCVDHGLSVPRKSLANTICSDSKVTSTRVGRVARFAIIDQNGRHASRILGRNVEPVPADSSDSTIARRLGLRLES